MANPFPYNQCVAGFTPTSGPYAGYCFSASIYHTGTTIGQYTPQSGTSPVQYGASMVTGALGGGDANSAYVFLVNASNQATAPYYFVCGSTNGNYYLYALTPTTDPASTQPTVKCVNQIGTLSSAVQAMFYDPTPGAEPNFLVIGSNGEWAAATVMTPPGSTVPTFAPYVNAAISQNLVEGGAASLTGAQLQIAAPPAGSNALPGVCYIAGSAGPIPGMEKTGTLMQFSGSNASTTQWILGCNDYIPGFTVAIACATSCIYIATVSGAIYQCTYPTSATNPTTTVTQINFPQSSGQTITSLAWSAVPSNPASSSPPPYPNGILVIGGYETSTGTGANAQGNVWTYVPGASSCTNIYSQPYGGVFGLEADQNGHVLAVIGETGLELFDLTGDGAPNIGLVANDETGSSIQWGKWIAYGEILFGLATDDPAAILFGSAGVIAANAEAAS